MEINFCGESTLRHKCCRLSLICTELNNTLMVWGDVEDVEEKEQTNMPYGKAFSDHRTTAEACGVYKRGKLGRKTRQKALLLVWLNHISLYSSALVLSPQKSLITSNIISAIRLKLPLVLVWYNRSEIKCRHKHSATDLSFSSSFSKPICLKRDNGG